MNDSPYSPQERKQRTIDLQKAKMETYRELKDLNLPIPPDLRAECEPYDTELASA